MRQIRVNLDKRVSHSYEICIGYDVLDRFIVMIAKNHQAPHYVVITDSQVRPLHGEQLVEKMGKAGLNVNMVSFPAGEASKTVEVMLSLVGELLHIGTDRNSLIVALGGGVVGDIAGFIASVFMRSLPYIQIPTTLMAQVDSSIGGKTGIDLPQGKNLLGTFYQPRGVYSDVKFLETLPEDEYKNGLVEVVKYAAIEDVTLLTFLENNIEAVRGRDQAILEDIVERSSRIKKGIVEIDEREGGIRRMLNFGHTIGHAIEAESGFSVPHGYAVSIGMIAAMTISERLHGFPKEERVRIEGVLRALGVPVSMPASLRTEAILDRLKVDKKKEGRTIHFVLLKKLGMPFINGNVPEDILRETIEGLKHDVGIT